MIHSAIAEMSPAILNLFDEKPIHLYSKETYRFNWLREGEKPIVIRIELSSPAQGRIIVKQTDGFSGFGIQKFGKMYIQEERELKKEEVLNFRKTLKKYEFWETPFKFQPPPPGGTYWEVEGVNKGTKHLLHDIEPAEGNVLDIGVHFLLLSTLAEKEEFIRYVEERERKEKLVLIGTFSGLLLFISLFMYKKFRSRKKEGRQLN